jgi:FHA domain
MPTLRIKFPDKGEETHVISGDRVTIGRRPDNTIQIADRSVSAHHAELVATSGHYRLHDLGSTNLSFVDGLPVTDYHLHTNARIVFGSIECEFDASANPVSDLPMLTAAQMEKEVDYWRAENSELTGKIQQLERTIDILNSARLVTGKTDTAPYSASGDTIKAITSERDDLRHQNVGLKLELEQLREELGTALCERDEARQMARELQADKATLARELRMLGCDPDAAQFEAQRAELPTHIDVCGADATQKLNLSSTAERGK